MTERPDPLESVLRAAFNAGEPVEDDGEALLLPADPDLPVPYTVSADDNAGKGTRGGSQPPAGEPTLSSDVLDLLAAIRDMAHVPMPDLGETNEREHRVLMVQRLAELRIALDVALSPEWVGTLDAAREAAYLRGRLADSPVTYTVYERPADGGGRS